MSLTNSISKSNVFFNLMYNLNFKIMKVQKIFEASTESTSMKEITDVMYGYELSRLLEDIIQEDPTRIVKVNLNVTIEY